MMNSIMPLTYQNPEFSYQRSPDQDASQIVTHPVIIVGAGPTGLTVALDLASREIPVVVLSKDTTVSIGSRAICFSKKTLEIMNRLNPEMAAKMLDKGITWNRGKVFYKDNKVYEFNLLPESAHKFPAFINLQQYYFEEYLIEVIQKHTLIDLRWHNEVIHIQQKNDKVWLEIQTPEGNYELKADYLLACDGAHSLIREKTGASFSGEQFDENFLIADITMEGKFPTERWFWFDPPFNPGFS
ncbi:MAG: FAD-dependent monooxygenase, partial [Bacteroidetes bacterium]|nr:FAD-dependent monooxygenase [Bacteroidota bacterium]